MSESEVITICNRLKNSSILLSPDNPWLLGCIEWYKSQNDLVNIQHLLEYVCSQWLLADLHDIQEPCLPNVRVEDVCTKLTGKYCVQVNWMRDVGQSSYSQLKNLQVASDTINNETLTIDKPEKWEPKPTRLYMLEITDGVNTLCAMEYTRINKLQEATIPGTKVLISGPIECRRGVLLLQENNLVILGGEVASLLTSNSTENILAKSLNLQGPLVEYSFSQRNSVSTPQPISYHDTTMNSNNSEAITNSTTGLMDLLASDEEEALLLQVHTETLVPVSAVDRQDRTSNQRFNVINPSSLKSDSNKDNFKKPFSEYKNQQKNVNQRNLPSNPPIINAKHVRNNKEVYTVKGINPFPKISTQNVPVNTSKPLDETLILSDEEDSIFEKIKEQPQFPFCKQIDGSVQSLTSKLKIREGEWTTTAMITDGNTSFEVKFSSEVLEELFGFSAVEIQAKRGEMAVNPAIKERINAILKSGQEKLKSLKCTMTIEYYSPSELPRVLIADIPKDN